MLHETHTDTQTHTHTIIEQKAGEAVSLTKKKKWAVLGGFGIRFWGRDILGESAWGMVIVMVMVMVIDNDVGAGSNPYGAVVSRGNARGC